MRAAQGVNQSNWQYYTYNADGQRVRRKVEGVETWQAYGMDGELLAEYAMNALATNPQKEYGYRSGQLLVTADAPFTINMAAAANGGTATASSAYSGYAASAANNGDRKGLNIGSNGVWSTAASGFPAWLQIDFNGSKTISEIDVFTEQDNYTSPVEPTETMTFSSYGLTGYDVQYWDGSSWVTITNGSVTSNNKVWRKFTFSSITSKDSCPEQCLTRWLEPVDRSGGVGSRECRNHECGAGKQQRRGDSFLCLFWICRERCE